jgi:hypothetical protein
MQAKRKYLKGKNVPVVVIFILWCVALYATFLAESPSFWTDLQGKYATLSKKSGLVVTMMPVLLLTLSGVVSSSVKAMLVFWRVRNVLPGHRAFTRLAARDPRIDLNELKKKMGSLPRAARDQNSSWFKLYKKCGTVPTVENPHRSFLLARDLSVIALIFAIGGSVGLAFGSTKRSTLLLYPTVMFVQYLLLALVARNHGNRLVCNVLVEYLARG